MLHRLAAIVGLVSLVASSAAAQTVPDNTWSPDGPRFSTILALVRDPSNPAVLYAGTYFGGLYRSSDYGFNWTHIPTAFSSQTDLSISNPSSGTIYVGTFNTGVYRSGDGGTTWEARNTGLTNLTVETVAADPNSGVVLAATTDGVFRSTNGSGSWVRVDTETPALRGKALVFDPLAPGVVYLGTIGRGIFRSVDGGATFQPFTDGIDAPGGLNVLSLRFGAPPSRHLYAGTDIGVFKLRRNTSVWANLTGNLPNYPISDVLPHPVVENKSIAATFAGAFSLQNDEASTVWTPWTNTPIRVMSADPTGFVFHAADIHGGLRATVDFGAAWYDANYGMQNLFIGALSVVDLVNVPVVYAGSDFALHRGAWGIWDTFFDQKQGVFDIQPDPAHPGTLYLGSERSGVWKTIDAGANWTPSSTNLVPAQIYALAQTANGSTMLAGTSSGLYLSSNNGAVWIGGNATQLGLVTSLAPDPTRAPFLFIGGSEGHVLFSQDGGWSFRDASNGLPAETILGLVTAPWEKTYAIPAGGGLYATSDNGLNWFPAKTGVAEPAMAIASEPVRSWILYLGTAGGGIYKSESGSLDWQPRNTGLTSPWVFSVAVDPSTPATVYAGTLEGVFKSVNGGNTWVRTSTGLAAGAVTTMVVDVAAPAVLYAAVQDAGLFRSSNGGQSWTSVSGSLPVTGAMPLLRNLQNPSQLLAGTALNGVFASPDSGSSWTRSSFGMTLFVRGLAVDPVQPSTIYAGSLGAGVFKSTDGAGNWTNVGLADRNVFKLAIDPTDSQKVYAATSRGVSRTTDGGATWSALGQKAAFAGAMVVDPTDRRRLWVAGAAGAVYRSANGGDTWESANRGLPLATVLAMAYDAASNLLYAAAERHGAWRSADRGSNWQPITGGAFDAELVSALTVTADHRVFAATIGAGVFVYGGGVWSSVSAGLATPRIADVESAGGNTLLAATFDAGVFRSVDGGLNWSWASSGLTTLRVNALTADPFVAGRFYAATPDGVFRSNDGGLAWVAANTGIRGINTWSVGIDPTAPGHLLAATNGSGVFVSPDSGQSWTPATGLLNYDVRDVAAGALGRFYAATLGGGIARSLDGGLTWSGGSGHDVVDDFILAVVVNPTDPSIVYAATSGRGILKTTNGGINWRPVTNGLGSLFLLSLAIDRQHPDTLYAGTADGGVFVTVNGGATWKPLNDGLFNTVVTSLAISPLDARRIYAGTEGGGVFTNHVSLPATSCTYAPSAMLIHVGPGATQATLSVATGASCPWRMESESSWLAVSGSATRTGSGSVAVTVELSTGQDARSGLIFIAGQPVTIVQSGLARLHRLTILHTGTGAGAVGSTPSGIACGSDCEQLFAESDAITLTATPAPGSAFAGWEGAADCADGVLTLVADAQCTARFEQTQDFDEDGLPNLWEAKYGLDAGSATGDDGADGDPDHDGRTNLQELADGTHPRGLVVRALAQGRADGSARTALALFNPGATDAHVLVRFEPDAGVTVAEYRYLPALARATIETAALNAPISGEFAIVIESDRTVVAERTIVRNAPFALSGEVASAAPSSTWYIATGTTRTGRTTTYSLFNPGAVAAPVTVTYLPSIAAPLLKAHSVPAGGRLVVDLAADTLAIDQDVAAVVVSDAPIVVEVTVGFNGALSAELAAPVPAYLQYLADGSTGPLVATVVDVLNPTGSQATATLTYVLAAGGIAQRSHTVAPYSRLSFDPSGDDALLANARFGIIIGSSVPVVVSSTTSWPGTLPAGWYASGTTGALPAAGTRWAFATGDVYGTDFRETEISIANVTGVSGTARIRLVFDDGTSAVRNVAIPAVTKVSIDVGQTFPEAAWRSFSALIESMPSGPGAPPDFVVEHAVYASPGGVSRAGGMRINATRLTD